MGAAQSSIVATPVPTPPRLIRGRTTVWRSAEIPPGKGAGLSDDASPIGSAPRDPSAPSRPLPPEVLRESVGRGMRPRDGPHCCALRRRRSRSHSSSGRGRADGLGHRFRRRAQSCGTHRVDASQLSRRYQGASVMRTVRSRTCVRVFGAPVCHELMI